MLGRAPERFQESRSSTAQASTSSKSDGELLAMNVITFRMQVRLTWQG